MKSVFLVVAMLFATSAPLLAQDVCHYSGKAYSSGSSLRLGEVLITCAPQESGAYAWFVVTDGNKGVSANCLYAGQEYSHGALLAVRESSLVCGNGRWYKEKE